MEIEKLVSKDIWAVIDDNYEKGSYTIAVTNLLQYANEIVREKSGLSLDNTKLMEAAFLGQNPKLKVNKFQTETEKDIQAGIGYLLKGLCMAVRNPRAHERYNDKKEIADKIIVFVDYVLEFVRNSKQPALVEDWLEFVFNENFNNTKEYARIVLQEIPEKKKYDLLVSIFRYRERTKEYQLNNLVNILMDTVKSEELQEFLENLNQELLYCKDDRNLRMFLSLFPPEKWGCLKPLTKLRIEHMIENSLEQATMVLKNNVGYNEEPEYTCNGGGALSTWAVNYVPYFDTRDRIYQIIDNKLGCKDVDARNFVIEYFDKIIFDDELIKNEVLKYGIKKSLKYFDRKTYEQLDFLCNFIEDEKIKEIFGNEVEAAKKYFDEMESKNEEIPF